MSPSELGPVGAPAIASTPLGSGATVDQVRTWVESMLRHDPRLDARLVEERTRDGVGPMQLCFGGRGYGKRARAVLAARAAGYPVTWVGLDEPIASAPRWSDYRIDPVIVHPDDLADVTAPGLVREAARAAADDPAATLGGPARAVSVRPAPRPTRSRSTR